MTDSTTNIIARALCDGPDIGECLLHFPEGREVCSELTCSAIVSAQAVEQALDEAGLVVVPREPTEEMLKAGYIWLDYCVENQEHPEPRSGWTNMLRAYKGEKNDATQ